MMRRCKTRNSFEWTRTFEMQKLLEYLKFVILKFNQPIYNLVKILKQTCGFKLGFLGI